MVEDLNMEIEREPETNWSIPETPISLMSVNQPVDSEHTMPSQSSGKKIAKPKDNLVKGFGEVASKLFKQLADKFDKSKANYPKYLAEELDRLGFSVIENLKISKVMRTNPSNVEVFKIIKNDAEKIAFAREFLDN